MSTIGTILFIWHSFRITHHCPPPPIYWSNCSSSILQCLKSQLHSSITHSLIHCTSRQKALLLTIPNSLLTQTRRSILLRSSPRTAFLLLSQPKLQRPSVKEKVMVQPTPCVRLPIQRRFLDIDILRLTLTRLILRATFPRHTTITSPIKVMRNDPRRLPRHRTRDARFAKERRGDEIHVLSCNRPKAQHAKHDERSHGARIVVSRHACQRAIEEARDIKTCPRTALAWSTGVVVLEDVVHAWFVTDIEEFVVVQEIQPAHEFVVAAAEEGD